MGNYKSSAGNFKITLLTAPNKFHWATWLSIITPWSHIVYKFSCGNCNVFNYRKTELHFNARSNEHISISHLTGNRVESRHLQLQITFYCITMTAILTTLVSYVDKKSILISRDSPVLSNIISLCWVITNGIYFFSYVTYFDIITS